MTNEGECYVTDIPGQEFDEIWVFKCGWQPLPEGENPWRAVLRVDPTTYPDELLEEMGVTREQVASEKVVAA